MLGEFDKAMDQLQTAVKMNARDYDAQYTLGLAHLKRRDVAQARRIYDQMLGQLGSKPQLHVLIGRAFRETGFLSEAIDEFAKAVELDPRFPRVHFYLGLTYLLRDGADRLGDAEKQFKIELAEHPDEFFASYYLGITATVQRNWTAAVDYLQKAAKVQPETLIPISFWARPG